ncbi:hypothetical protein [Ammoniphilus sp. CFH 90114]|uniref:hypothetical protein n=1 Tax=Ammoniphilus sp. CFH 90114 TaxID=2493665 RepID=UPI00100EA041|nr:hypothetical protein [Ammoniphilus sp. CFH 90114]RXT13744.1 hypothetical protein EIZ39_06250 [Ammoniphilus sp. CFH 90114]
MSFSLGGLMLYAMWAVLGVMMVDFIVASYRALKRKYFSADIILEYLKDFVFYIFPLFLIANMTGLDPTGWILLIAYFGASLAVLVRYLSAIKRKL